MANEFSSALKPLLDVGRFDEIREFSENNPELVYQRESAAESRLVDEMVREGSENEVMDIMKTIAESVDALNRVVGGLESDDISFEVDPQTGRSKLSVIPKAVQGEGAALGTAEKEYMVYQRKADDDSGNPQYGFDYVRSVAATEG
jgi:hypothetical protein